MFFYGLLHIDAPVLANQKKLTFISSVWIFSAVKVYFIPYILVDASGWAVSDVSFGIMGGFGSFNIRPPHPNDQVGIDLTPTPIPAATQGENKKKMTTEKALYIILQQPIRAKLY